MMRRISGSIFVLTMLLSGTAGYVLGNAGGSESPLWTADEAFNRSLAERNARAFASWLHEDAVFLGAGLLEGREAILEAWAPFLDRESGRTMHWQPHTAVMSRCEDVGYTMGEYVLSEVGIGGEPTRLVGTYISVWQRGEDRAWRVVADAGTAGEEESEY